MTLPLVEALRDDPSVGSVTAVCPGWIAPLLQAVPGIVVARAGWEKTNDWLPGTLRNRPRVAIPLERIAAVRDGRAQAGRYDLVVVPRWDADCGSCREWAFATGAVVAAHDPRTNPAAPQRELAQAGRIDIRCISSGPGHHELEQNAALASCLGIETAAAQGCGLRLDLSEVKPPGLPNEFLAVHVGARAPHRRWPEASWAGLIDRVESDIGLPTVLLGGPSDRSQTRAIRGMTRGTVDFGGLPLVQMASILRRSVAFVGSDSGPMHVACALEKPVVVVSAHPRGASNVHANSPTRFGPWSSRAVALQPLAASDTCREGCTAGEPHCIRGVEPSDVASAVMSVLHAGQ